MLLDTRFELFYYNNRHIISMREADFAKYRCFFELLLLNALALTIRFYHLDLFYFLFDFLLFAFVVTLLYVRIKSANTFSEPRPFEAPVEYVSMDQLRQATAPLFSLYRFNYKLLIRTSIKQKVLVVGVLIIIGFAGTYVDSFVAIVAGLNLVVVDGHMENQLMKGVESAVWGLVGEVQ